MPVSTRSMTINATMERERMRREIREANATKRPTGVEERDMLDVFQKYLYQSLRLPEALEADDGVLSSTMEQEELLDSDSKTEVSLMVKTENDEFEMTMDIEMDLET
ncbi:hypothetical protein BD769DRAFT_1682047 [Suillus cothurnatus]|nr:hypothetical protein BD769DRAFT_1682047 [Suillus cothurnatus]